LRGAVRPERQVISTIITPFMECIILLITSYVSL
jgi:hypothetical protein